MASDREPDDVRTMDDDAISLHEVYESLRRGGFDDAEALYLVGRVLTARLDKREGRPPTP